MWEVPNHRIRAYIKSLRKPRKVKKKSTGPTFHIKRVAGELKLIEGAGMGGKVLPTFLLLNDFDPKFLKVFLPESVRPGQEVAITIEAPKYFYIRGKVRGCQDMPRETQILTQAPFNYRASIEFKFQSDAEALMVKYYFEQIFSDYVFGNEY